MAVLAHAPQVTIAKECLGGREGWIIGRPPNYVLYGQPVDTALPPELHWALMNGGAGLDPPPTLMMHSQRRAKEVRSCWKCVWRRYICGDVWYLYGPSLEFLYLTYKLAWRKGNTFISMSNQPYGLYTMLKSEVLYLP